QPQVLRSAIGELVPGPVVNTDWDVDVLVDVKGQREPLSKHIDDVVVRVRAVVKISPKGGLPFCVWTTPRVSGAWKMKPSNCISRTPANSGRALKVASAKSQMQSVRSRNPTCGLKLGPIFLCSASKSSQLERKFNPAPKLDCPLE